ncbi:MAG: PQQ-binding-like beta-propeller repeat protein [Planctomycetota bacterium]
MRATLVLAAAAISGTGLLASLTQLSLAGDTWPLPRGDAASSGASTAQLPKELSVAWEFKADEAIEAPPVVSQDAVFLADVMGKLYAVSRTDGSKRWTKDYESGFLCAPVIAGDSLIIGDIDGTVFCLDVKSGEERWKQSTGGEISGAAGLYEDKVLISSQDGKLYCFELATGEPAWTYQADDQIRCAPTVAGDRTFLGGCDAKLHIVNLKTGEADGDTLPLDGPTGSTPAIRDNLAVVPAMDGVVFGFDWKLKKELWRYEDMDQAQEYRSSAAVADGIAVISSQRKHVDAIDTKTGKRIWRHTLRRRSDASPVIAGDEVWIPATDGRLVRLSLKDGEVLWSYEIRGGFVGGVAIAGKQLFIADDEGVLRCFGES